MGLAPSGNVQSLKCVEPKRLKCPMANLILFGLPYSLVQTKGKFWTALDSGHLRDHGHESSKRKDYPAELSGEFCGRRKAHALCGSQLS